jgi:hypothetical protein
MMTELKIGFDSKRSFLVKDIDSAEPQLKVLNMLSEQLNRTTLEYLWPEYLRLLLRTSYF